MGGDATLSLDEAQAALGERDGVRSVLGRGGMGWVLRVHDADRGEDVALKLLSPSAEHGLGLARFKREFRAGRRLSHPACVRTFDLGRSPLGWYFTLELMAGGTLADARARYAEPSRASFVVLQVLAALDHLHARGIVHRDVKPQNVLLADASAGSRAKLADLGIARVSDLFDDPGVGVVIGSPRYVAPEYVEHGTFDVRSDLFAVGVMLFELLSGGAHPYRDTGHARGSGFAWRAAPRPLRELAPEVPEPLAELVSQLVARCPEDRFRSAAEVFDALGAFLSTCERSALPELPPLRRAPYLAAPPLVGRRAEVDELLRFLDALTRDAPTTRPLLVLSGEGGHGKSRLISELLRLSGAHGFRCIVAGCEPDGGSDEALSSILFALRSLARSKSALTSSEPDALDAETAITPASHDPDEPTRDAAATRAAPEHGLVAERKREMALARLSTLFLEATEDERCLLVVEDAQWADAVLLDAVLTWVRALSTRPRTVGIVLTHRPAPDHAPLSELLARSAPRAVSIELAPMPAAATVELLSGLLSRPIDDEVRAFARRVFGDRASPLWVHQLMRLGLDRGVLVEAERAWTGAFRLDAEVAEALRRVGDVSAAIGERAARLSVHTAQMLRAASVVGRRFDASCLADVLEVPVDQLLDHLDEAEMAGFLAPDPAAPQAYSFEHDRIRETLYAQIDLVDRRTLHLRVAHALSRSPDAPSDAAELAHHYGAAGAHEPAYTHGIEAASAALARYAYRDAARFYREALAHGARADIAPDDRVSTEAATAFAHAGLYDAAHDLLGGLLAKEDEGSPERASLLALRGEIEFMRARLSRATEALERLLADLGEQVPRGSRPLVRAIVRCSAELASLEVRPPTPVYGAERERLLLACRLWTWLAEVYVFSDRRHAAYALLRAAAFAHRLGAGADAAAVFAGLSQVTLLRGRRRLATRFERRSIAFLRADDPPQGRARVETMLTLGCLLRGDPAAAVAHGAEGARWADRGADPKTVASAYTALALSLWVSGRVAESMRISRAMRERGRIHGNELLEHWGALHVMNCTFFLGRYGEALAEAEALEPFFVEYDNAVMRGVVRSRKLLCRALLAGPTADDLSDALALCESWLDRELLAFAANPVACCLGVAALRGARAPFDARTRSRIARIVRRARPRLSRSRVERALFVAAMACLDYVQGRRARASRRLEEALEHAERFGMVHDQSTCRVLAARIFDPADTLTRRCAVEAAALERRFRSEAEGGATRVGGGAHGHGIAMTTGNR